MEFSKFDCTKNFKQTKLIMTRRIAFLGLLALLLSCNSKKDDAQRELGLVYNVLRDFDSMGPTKRTLQTYTQWIGPTTRIRIPCILFRIGALASAAIFCTRPILMGKMFKKSTTWSWPIVG